MARQRMVKPEFFHDEKLARAQARRGRLISEPSMGVSAAGRGEGKSTPASTLRPES